MALAGSESHGGWESQPAEREGEKAEDEHTPSPDTVPETEDHLGRGACDGKQEGKSQEMEKKNQDKAVSWEPRKKKISKRQGSS